MAGQTGSLEKIKKIKGSVPFNARKTVVQMAGQAVIMDFENTAGHSRHACHAS
jgi:hypothetical protein